MRRRMVVALLPVALAALWILGCGRAGNPWEGEKGSPKVVVTIAPLYSFTKAVLGKDHGAVRCLCTSTGPHSYEGDPRDARLVQKADVVFSIGLQLDDKFTDGMIALTRRKDLPHVKLGDNLPAKLKLEQEEEEHDHKHADKHEHKHGDHEHGKYDPHVWLGIPQAINIVEQIRDELVRIDEKNADDYKKNAAEYIAKLKKLQKDGRGLLADKKNKGLITFHESLAYFAGTFGLKIEGVIEVGAGDEPSAGHLRDLIQQCQKHPVDVIAVEPQYPKKSSAETLRSELKRKGITAELVSIDPLETADAEELAKEEASWYETRMRRNLKALASAMK